MLTSVPVTASCHPGCCVKNWPMYWYRLICCRSLAKHILLHHVVLGTTLQYKVWRWYTQVALVKIARQKILNKWARQRIAQKPEQHTCRRRDAKIGSGHIQSQNCLDSLCTLIGPPPVRHTVDLGQIKMHALDMECVWLFWQLLDSDTRIQHLVLKSTLIRCHCLSSPSTWWYKD